MSDSAFTNNTAGTATELGTLAFPGNTFDGPTTTRIFDFDSVGIDFEPPFDFTTDIADHFTFDPYRLVSVSVNFNADTVGDFVNALIFVPVSGVSKVDGAVVGAWFGGVHEGTDVSNEDTQFVTNFSINSLNFIKDGGLGTTTDFTAATFSNNEFTGADAVWTLDGNPVVVRVLGLQGTGTTEQINDNMNIPDEVDYRFTILPKLGEVDEPEPEPQPTPQQPSQSGSTSKQFINDIDSSETIVGEAETDIYVAIGDREEFEITLQSDGNLLIVDSLFPDAPDTLVGIERLEFFDGTLAFDILGNAGQAYRLYQAAFDRTPDDGGLVFWVGSLDSGSADLNNAAANFVNSAEFTATYGTSASVSNADFVGLLYQNVLDRNAEGEGFNFWNGELNSGRMTREQVLINFSESNENQANVIGVIQNGIFLPDYETIV